MATASTQKTPPVSPTRLKQIAHDACESALGSADTYIHSKTESWNSTIISKTLESLLASAQTSTGTTAQYKYAVNSTIIQHISSPNTSSSIGTSTTTTQTVSPPGSPEAELSESAANGNIKQERTAPGAVAPEKGRRGMHSATGAYWNNETDGMWSYKYEGGDKRGMDVVLSVIWVAV